MAGSDQPLAFNMPARALDKIFYRPTPSTVAVSMGATQNIPIAHGKGTNFFLDAQISPDGSNWYDAGFEPTYAVDVGGGIIVFPRRFSMDWSVDATNVNLSITANDASYTFHYRMVGYTKE